MKQLALAAALAFAFAASPAAAETGAEVVFNGVTMERGFSFSNTLMKPFSLASEGAHIVREYGYKCDTVTSVRDFLMSYGFTIRCNRGRYTYDVADRGGRWLVTVE